RVELLERELSRLADAHEALVKSAERSARLETAVRRRLERECALLRQENAQLRDRLLSAAEFHHQQQHHQHQPATQETLQRLEAENLALKEQLLSSPAHQQQHNPNCSKQS
uniref:BZIP domain-containing protein n=2 Tax=Macrostomum lignano TaxID=282301 RepID=A0A1I8JJ35_9PLAT